MNRKNIAKAMIFMFLLSFVPVAFSGFSLVAEEAAKKEEVKTPAATTPADATKKEAEKPKDPAKTEDKALYWVNNVWMMIGIFLVFIMHLGFATVESGMAQAKNTVNILFKNTMIVAIGLLTYYAVGYGLMYGGFPAGSSGFFTFGGFGLDKALDFFKEDRAMTYYTDFLFQGMFAATAATIVSGAVAERVKLFPFLLFSIVFVAIVYPIIGSWKWGLGWLHTAGFYDFAGSSLVHSVGGWGALAGIMLLGPRIGKYAPSGAPNVIKAHSMPLATIGVFLLWLGWFGFNGASVLSANASLVSFVLVTTCLAGAAGMVGATLTAMATSKRPDLSMALNGTLAGLVGITAGADVISPGNAIIVGFIAGVIVVLSVAFFDKLKLDDPVGATSVHLSCGIWGTLAVGIFSMNPDHTLMKQLTGVGAIAVTAFAAAFIIFFLIKITIGLRVPRDEELKGLDIGEHGTEAYGGFQINDLE